MPRMPPRHRPSGQRTRQERDRDYERRRAGDPLRRWYHSPAWRRRRAQQLARMPYCEIHQALFGRTEIARSVNHLRMWSTWEAFIGGELESLCQTCHSKVSARERHGGVPYAGREDKDGRLIAPGHWFYDSRLALYGAGGRGG